MTPPPWPPPPPPHPLGGGVRPAPTPGFAGFAGFGARLTARLIDLVLIGFFGWGFYLVVTLALNLGIGWDNDLSEDYFNFWGAMFALGWGVLAFFYDWLFHVASGRTPGKLVLGIRVVSARDGGRLTQGQAVGRAALIGVPQTLPCVGHVLVLGFCLWMLSDDGRSAGLHDRVSDTSVVRTRR